MKMLSKNIFVIGLVLVLICPLGVQAAQSILIPKITNFIIVVDQSGSMFTNHMVFKGNVTAIFRRTILI